MCSLLPTKPSESAQGCVTAEYQPDLRPLLTAHVCVFQHGAKYIYDTDDDNFLKHDLSGFVASQQWSSHLVLVTDNLTNNPYVHFGQSTLWPRGYPLERVGWGAERRYSVCDLTPPAVQQGSILFAADLASVEARRDQL